jgi:tetratricopeptide (TPR) repeat protein
LQLATSDNDDEIRLLAFNLYDRREKVISAAISNSLQALHTTADPSEQVRLCRTLAFAYWEVLYNGMANNELADFFAGEAIAYANRAIQMGADDACLSVLLGRIHLWKGELEKAEGLIRAALEQGAYRERVISYLAEFAFRKRDFKTLRLYFRIYPSLCYKPGIGPVASFWRE